MVHIFLNVGSNFLFNFSYPSLIAKTWPALRSNCCRALIQTNKTSFATFRIFLHFSWIFLWMYAVTPTPYYECMEFSKRILFDQLRTFMVRSWCDRVKWLCGVDVTAYIQGTDLIRFRKVTLGGFCVHCTLYSGIHLSDFMFLLYTAQSSVLGFFSSRPNWNPRPLNRRRVCPPPTLVGGDTLACVWGGHFTELMWPRKVTLRSQKISIKWLWPVKVTLKVIWWFFADLCWWCPFKMNKKKLPSLQFVITDQMSLLSPLNLNDRSIPLKVRLAHRRVAWPKTH